MNLDWKNIVNKVLSWGFCGTFSILGIVLMGTQKYTNVPIYAGLAIALFGALCFVITLIFNGKLQTMIKDNTVLTGKVDELSKKVDELSIQVVNLKSELDRKQNKINLLENENKVLKGDK